MAPYKNYLLLLLCNDQCWAGQLSVLHVEKINIGIFLTHHTHDKYLNLHKGTTHWTLLVILLSLPPSPIMSRWQQHQTVEKIQNGILGVNFYLISSNCVTIYSYAKPEELCKLNNTLQDVLLQLTCSLSTSLTMPVRTVCPFCKQLLKAHRMRLCFTPPQNSSLAKYVLSITIRYQLCHSFFSYSDKTPVYLYGLLHVYSP